MTGRNALSIGLHKPTGEKAIVVSSWYTRLWKWHEYMKWIVFWTANKECDMKEEMILVIQLRGSFPLSFQYIRS